MICRLEERSDFRYVFFANVVLWFMMYGSGSRLRRFQPTLYYIHSDHLDTPQVVTNQTQQVVWMGSYEPFGKLTESQTNSIELFSRFPGQYLDKESGLYYNYFRDYDPSIGRYIESDPIGLEGGINTYGYVRGNPVNDYDPLGLNQMNRSPYAPGGSLYIPSNYTPGFGDGYSDYFHNLANLNNPYMPGSCEYNRREEAMRSTEALINMVPYSPTVQEAIVHNVAQQVQSNPSYYAGRAVANMTVSVAAGSLGRGLGSGAIGGLGRAGLKGSAAATGFSLATYMALVEKVESNLPQCECNDKSK